MCIVSNPQEGGGVSFANKMSNLATPFTEILLDSVAPEVKMISLGSALIRSAT